MDDEGRGMVRDGEGWLVKMGLQLGGCSGSRGLKKYKKKPPLRVPPIIVKLISVKYSFLVLSKNPKKMYNYVTQIKFF